MVATIAEGTNVTGTTYAFSQESFILATAVGKDLNAAANNTFEITGSGVPTEAGNDSFTVTITGAPQEIVLTLPDDFTAFQNKNESVIVTLPDGMTYNDVTYSMQNGAGAACKMTVEPGERENELVVNHGGICGGDGSSTLIVTSKSNPNCTGSLVIRCNV